MEAIPKACPPGIGPRGLDGRGVHVKALDAQIEARGMPLIARLRLVDERSPECAVMLAPAREAGPRPHQARGHVCSHQRCLDRQRARSAHGIDESTALRHHLWPAGDKQNGSGQVFLERGERAPHPVTTAVQALTRKIDAQRGDVSVEMGVDPQIRPLEIDGWPRPTHLAHSIDDRIFDLERPKVRVRYLGISGTEVDGQGSSGPQVIAPVEAADTLIERLGRRRCEGGDRQEHPTGRARPETGAVTDLERPDKGHPRAAWLDIAGAERLELFGEDLLDPLGRRCKEAM